MSMRRGLWLFLAGRAFEQPGIAAGFAKADDANWSKAAPALGGNPSFAESIDAGGASSPLRAFPRHSHRLTPNVAKNKTSRDRAFR